MLGVQRGDVSLSSPYVWLGLFFFTIPAGLIVYGPNDITDRESDAMNHRKGHIAGVVLSNAEVKTITHAAIYCAMLFIGVYMAAERYGVALIIAAIALLSAAYSLPPLRLKSRPGLDALVNGIMILLVFLCGYSMGSMAMSCELPPVGVMVLLLCAGAAMHIFGTVVDYDVDVRAGDRTLAVAIGQRGALLLAMALIAVCISIVYGGSIVVTGYLAFAFIVLGVLCIRPSAHWLRVAMWALLAGLIICGAVVVFS